MNRLYVVYMHTICGTCGVHVHVVHVYRYLDLSYQIWGKELKFKYGKKHGLKNTHMN
jgi:hypothetical protein